MSIVPRSAWGARLPKRVDTVAPSVRKLFIVHYSYGPADQQVRSIQDWCMDAKPKGRGFSDIDYNFLVRGTTGETYEGRGWDVIGSHTSGHNTEGIGVCVITPGPISTAAQASLRWLYAEAVRRAGHTLAVVGHRDLDSTVCPGDEIYRWVHAGGVSDPAPARGPRTLALAVPFLFGQDVLEVQRVLGVLPDHIFGPATERALIAWQRAHGLTADGIVGPATRRKMGL